MFLRIRTRSPSSFLFHKLSKSHSLALTRSLPSIPSVPFVKPAISRHQISLWPSITTPAHQNLLLKIRKIRNVRSQSLCFLKPYWVSSMFWGSVLGTNFIMAPKEKWSMLFFPRPTRALVSLFYTLLHPPASTPPSLPLLILDEQLGRPYLSYFSLTSVFISESFGWLGMIANGYELQQQTNFSSLHRTSDSWCLALWQQPDFNHSGACRGHTSWKLSSECGLMAIILEMVAASYSLCKNFLMPCTFLVPSHILILPLPPISLWSAPCIKILIFKIPGVISV